MSLGSIFDIAGMAMSAQTVRLNTVASNLANAETVAASEGEVYRARHPVFKAMQVSEPGFDSFDAIAGEAHPPFGVMVTQIVESQAAANRRYQPDHPMADDQGYVFYSNVNTVEEMADMISASRAFQLNVEMMNTSKSMMQRLLTLGQ